jgi:hypothetical protein
MLWSIARGLGLDSALLHEVVRDETGSEHISTLSRAQIHRVIDRLQGKSLTGVRGHVANPGGISKEQLGKILKLSYLVFSGDATDEQRAESGRRLRGWILHMSKGLWRRPDDLSAVWAGKIIESLRALAHRKHIPLSESDRSDRSDSSYSSDRPDVPQGDRHAMPA